MVRGIARIWAAGLALAPLGVFGGPALPAQQPPVVACRVCSNHGTLPCGKHGKLWDVEQPEHGTVFCSVVSECKTCAGALAVDCKTCRNTAAEQELARRQQLAKDWLGKRRAAVDAVTDDDPLWHLQSRHVDLVFGIRPTTIGKEKVDTHPLMHLYADRIEALRDLYLKTFELRDDEQTGRLQIYMFRSGKDQAAIGPRVTGIGSGQSTGTKLMGVDCVYSMWQDLRSFPDDDALFRGIVHNVTHLLLCNTTPPQVLNNRKAGWIDEGVAHWFEDKLTGKCTNICFEEILLVPGTSFKGGRWRAPVRKLVDEGKVPPFAALSVLNTDQLDFHGHATSFALVDWLLTVHGGAKLRDLVRLVKQDKPIQDALQAVYGLNPITIDAPFHQWVKDNYSPLEAR
jgi:hypothetical protein